MAEQGCEYAVVECSSQGLKLSRTDFIDFDLGIFLNIEKGDHISPTEHKDFAEYLDCKRKLLRSSRTCIVNGDDRQIDEMLDGVSGKVIKYGAGESCDYIVSDIRETRAQGRPCVSFRLTVNERSKETDEYVIGMPGVFNVGNAASACIAARECGVPVEAAKKALTVPL